eukprot:SAG31_NODE_5778_length_2331_cov_1.497312_1_plen_145_part_00
MFGWCEVVMARDRLSFPFNVGDIQFASNHVCTHGRDGHAEVAEQERKRLLLRVWLDLPGNPAAVDEHVQRYGVIRHGNLGYTAAELRAGLHDHHRHRDQEELEEGAAEGSSVGRLAEAVAARRDDGASLRPPTTPAAAAATAVN